MKKNLFILILFFLSLQLSLQIDRELIFFYEHCRHGARLPIFDSDNSYTDEFGVKWEGDSELTKKGLRMEYVLGLRNRERYSKLIGDVYDPKKILVLSTDYNRTLNSMQAQLLAMFPPGKGLTFNANDTEEKSVAFPPNQLTEEVIKELEELGNEVLINTNQLIPIHSYKRDGFYYYITGNTTECPKLNFTNQILSSDLRKFSEKFEKQYGNALRNFIVSKKQPDTYITDTDFNPILNLLEDFYVNIEDLKDLSNFYATTKITEKSFNETFREFKEIFLHQIFCNKETCMMHSSPIIRDVLIWMQNRVDLDKNGNGDTINYSKPKAVLQSGHDTTLGSISFFLDETFDLKKPLIPSFGSNMHLEVYKVGNNKYNVTYLFDDEELFNMDFEDFKKKINQKIWSKSKINNACFNVKSNKILLASTIILAITTAVFLFLSIFFLYRKNPNSLMI